MTAAELADWNNAKLSELGGDALDVATDFVRRFPDAKIISAARDYKEQARVMAQNACAQRDNGKTTPGRRLTWIAETYWPGRAARTLQAWFGTHPTASEPDCVSNFMRIMSMMTPDDLRKLSKHIVITECDDECIDDKAEAFDIEVPSSPLKWDMYCAVLREEALKRGGRFLAKEGGEVRGHWQSGDKE